MAVSVIAAINSDNQANAGCSIRFYLKAWLCFGCLRLFEAMGDRLHPLLRPLSPALSREGRGRRLFSFRRTKREFTKHNFVLAQRHRLASD